MAQTLIPAWTLTDRLAKARTTAGYTQAELATELGLSLSTVRRYEQGSHAPRRIDIYGWAVTCGIDPVWLETGTVSDTVTHEYMLNCVGQLSMSIAA
jgi:transcriptional regulator with XRE-family HTH domain